MGMMFHSIFIRKCHGGVLVLLFPCSLSGQTMTLELENFLTWSYLLTGLLIQDFIWFSFYQLMTRLFMACGGIHIPTGKKVIFFNFISCQGAPRSWCTQTAITNQFEYFSLMWSYCIILAMLMLVHYLISDLLSVFFSLLLLTQQLSLCICTASLISESTGTFRKCIRRYQGVLYLRIPFVRLRLILVILGILMAEYNFYIVHLFAARDL